jgi:hypothetical protein
MREDGRSWRMGDRAMDGGVKHSTEDLRDTRKIYLSNALPLL